MRIRQKTHWISFAVGLAVMCIPIFGFFQERVFSYSKYGASSFVYLSENPKQYWSLMIISFSIALFFLFLSELMFVGFIQIFIKKVNSITQFFN